MPALPPPALVVFDCDGVLVDSERLASECFSEALEEIGLQRSPGTLDEVFRGRRMDVCLQEVARWLGRPLPAEFAARLQARTLARMEAELAPVPGAPQAVARVRDELGLKVCVASSSAPERIALSLARTGLAHWFGDAVFSASQVRRGKPAPDLFLHAARRLDVAPDECVVIEDSEAGLRAGLAAGMRTFAYVAEPVRRDPTVLARCTQFDRMDALTALLDASTAD